LSPYLQRFFISPNQLYKDLSLLSQHCRPDRISLIGGEPLLHPDILKVVNVVRRSGISKRIRVVTNGILLHKMTDQFWQDVDEVHVSLYPSHPMKVNDLSIFQKLARSYNTNLVLRYQDYFQEHFSAFGTPDDQLVKRIYLTCKIRSDSGCNTLYQGHYYKCPQAVFIPQVYGERFDFGYARDGIKITDHDALAETLAAYLSSNEALAACKYCLGSVGKMFIPVQEKRSVSFKPTKSDELIDWKQLEKLERRIGLPLPDWLRETLQPAHSLFETLPPSVLLSPTFRRGITILKKLVKRSIS
jgi:hypothetical protein